MTERTLRVYRNEEAMHSDRASLLADGWFPINVQIGAGGLMTVHFERRTSDDI